jgi:sodium-dependent dicarboxylate transporter 2/3/5
MKFNSLVDNRATIGFFLGIIVFIFFLLFPLGANPNASYMAAVTSLMVIWWVTEAIPIGATSLIPIVIFPLLGIINGNDVAREYFNSTIMIFIGGFLIALAMQRWMLHKRISLMIIKLLGTSTSGIVLGFMAAATVISMFISNVATTVMLLPIGLAFIYELEAEFNQKTVHNFSVSIMLGIAYSSSIGGIATLIGTAPNLIFQRIYEMNFPEMDKITFAGWIGNCMPISIIMMISAWLLLTKVLFKPSKDLIINRSIIIEQLEKLGKITYQEIIVLIVFMITVLLWLFRVPIDTGFFKIPGWSQISNLKNFVDDGTVAIFSGLLLFMITSNSKKDGKGDKIINIDILSQIPWEVILIFGGGFALAKGFTDSGLSSLIGDNFNNLQNLSPTFMTAVVCTILTFLTELTSNTATTNTVLPILASIAKANNINPLILMLPATISASFAFMLPVGTPPNAIVYGSGKINIMEMVKAGFILNIIGIIVVTVYFMIFVF